MKTQCPVFKKNGFVTVLHSHACSQVKANKQQNKGCCLPQEEAQRAIKKVRSLVKSVKPN